MRDEHDEGLTHEERSLLDSLPAEATPPAALEERVVAGLKSEGMIRTSGGPRRWAPIAATLLLAAALSFYAGTRFAATPPPSPDGGTAFALLIYDRPGPAPEALTQAAVAEATEWVGELVSGGSYQASAKLSDDGSRLALEGEELTLATGVPALGAELVLGGFFMIRADSYDEAQRIAATCPLLRYGSTIEVRAVEIS